MIPISKILLPVDFSEEGAHAAPYAVGLARHFHATLTMLHVSEIYAPALLTSVDLQGPIDTGWITVLELERLRKLESYQQDEFRGLHVQRTVVSGEPSRRIAEYVHQEKIDLIVMSTHGYGPFRRFLLGSVTAKVLHDVACPVWTGAHLQETSPHGWQPVRHVLCAIDGGTDTERVLTWAKDFAAAFGAAVSVVHVIPEGGKDRFNAATEHIECLKKKFQIVGDTHIATGEPATEVASAAVRTNASVLVIGRSPALKGLGRLRANAYAIIRESPCPVVSI